MVHPFQEPEGIPQDYRSLSPGQRGCQEAGNFAVLFQAEAMGYTEGVVRNERLDIKSAGLFFQEIPEVFNAGKLHGTKVPL